MAEYFSVDRTENGIAVLVGEKGERREVPFSRFDAEPRETMVYRFENNLYVHDEAEELLRKKRIFELQKNLFKK